MYALMAVVWYLIPELQISHCRVQRAGQLIYDWKKALLEDKSATLVVQPSGGTKRSAAVSV